jgi:hypothetical protein
LPNALDGNAAARAAIDVRDDAHGPLVLRLQFERVDETSPGMGPAGRVH